MEESQPSISGDVPEDLVRQVVEDAALRAGADPNEVAITLAEAVTWSDGSLGCPKPGMAYTQALVPGYRVVIEAEDEEMSYHASSSGDFVFCQNPQPPIENPDR